MKKVLAISLVAAFALAAGSTAEARGGCGLGWHRGPGGGCVRNGTTIVVEPKVVVKPAIVVAPAERPCPVGWHLGPHGRRCFRNW